MKLKLGWWLVVPVLLVTTAFAAHSLTVDMYWGDETATLRKIGVPPYPSQNVLEIIENVARSRWLPAYDFQLFVWGRLLGWSEFGTRAYSLFIGLIAISLIYRAGRYLTDGRVGLAAAALMGTSVVQIFYMHEMRAYTLYIMLTIMAIVLYRYILTLEKPPLPVRVFFVGVFTMLMYTHYFASFVVGSIGLYHLLFQRKSPNWMRILRLFVVVGVLFLPWLPLAFLQLRSEAEYARGLPPIELIRDIVNAYGNGLPILLAAFLICAVWTPYKRILYFLSFCAVTYLLMAMAMNVVATSLVHIRHIIGLFPFVLLLAALGVHRLYAFNRIVATVAVVIFAAGGLYASFNTVFMDNLSNAHKSIPLASVKAGVDVAVACGGDEDALVTHFSRNVNEEWDQVSTEYYFHPVTYPFGMLGFLADLRELEGERVTEITDYPATRDTLLQNRSRVWVLAYPEAYQAPPVDELDEYLAEEYEYCAQFIDTETLLGYVYSNEPETTCSAVSDEPISLAPCEPGLINRPANADSQAE